MTTKITTQCCWGSDRDTVSLFITGLERAIRRPVSTILSLLYFAVSFVVIAGLQTEGSVGHATAMGAGAFLATFGTMTFILFIALDRDKTPNLTMLFRTVILVSAATGIGSGLYYALALHLLTEWVDLQSYLNFLQLVGPFHYVAMGPVLCFGALPALLIGWPIRVAYGLPIFASIRSVEQTVQGELYQPRKLSVLMAIFLGGLSLCPLFALFAPVYVIQLSASAFEIYENHHDGESDHG